MNNNAVIKGPRDLVTYVLGQGYNVFDTRGRLAVALTLGSDGVPSVAGIEDIEVDSPDTIGAFVKRVGGSGYATIVSRGDDTPGGEVIPSDLLGWYGAVDATVKERFGFAAVDLIVVGAFEGIIYSFKNKEFYQLFTPREVAVA